MVHCKASMLVGWKRSLLIGVMLIVPAPVSAFDVKQSCTT